VVGGYGRHVRAVPLASIVSFPKNDFRVRVGSQELFVEQEAWRIGDCLAVAKQLILIGSLELLVLAVELGVQSFDAHLGVSRVLLQDAGIVVSIFVAQRDKCLTKRYCASARDAETEDLQGNFAFASPAINVGHVWQGSDVAWVKDMLRLVRHVALGCHAPRRSVCSFYAGSILRIPRRCYGCFPATAIQSSYISGDDTKACLDTCKRLHS